MRDDDPADLDGDGEFDAIDLEIWEENQIGRNDKSGCTIFIILPLSGILACVVYVGLEALF